MVIWYSSCLQSLWFTLPQNRSTTAGNLLLVDLISPEIKSFCYLIQEFPPRHSSVIFSLFMILAKTTVYVLLKSGNGEQKWRQNVQYCVSEVRSTTRPLPSEVSHHLSGLLSEAGDSSQTTQQNHSLVLCIPLPSHHECIPSLENCQRSCRWHDPELH